MSADFDNFLFKDPQFRLAEIKTVTVPMEGAAGGGVSVTFQPDQKNFSSAEWQKLKEANLDFSVIG